MALKKPENCSFLQVWKKEESAELQAAVIRGGKETGVEEVSLQHGSRLPWASAAAVSQEETQNWHLGHMPSV